MPNPISHAEMIAAVNEAIEAAEMEAQGYRNGASISDDDERLLREAEAYQRHADDLRAVLAHLERTQPTDTTERARALVHDICPNDFGQGPCDYPACRDSMCEFWKSGDKIAATLQSEREAAAAEARRAAPILSKYHGARGFEVERFIADYEAWKAAAPPAPHGGDAVRLFLHRLGFHGRNWLPFWLDGNIWVECIVCGTRWFPPSEDFSGVPNSAIAPQSRFPR